MARNTDKSYSAAPSHGRHTGLQAERLVCAIRYLSFTLQFAPTVIIPEPNQVAVFIGHLSWNADLVAVEVVGLLSAFAIFVGPVMYLCQRSVAVGIGVDIGIPAVRLDFLQQMAAVPNKSGFLFEAV